MAEREYQRLTRSSPRSIFAVAITSRASLWLGREHLLLIDSNGYTETYKRFYFRDIQAFTIGLTKQRLMWNWILGGLMLIWLLLWAANFLSSSAGLAALIAFSIGTALLGLPLLLNNFLGPTCTCQIRTAVQTEDLHPLKRLGQTRRVLARLRPHILEAQNKLAVKLEQPLEQLEPGEVSPSPAAASTNRTEAVDQPAAPTFSGVAEPAGEQTPPRKAL